MRTTTTRRPRRPAAHFLDLGQGHHLIDTAWNLADPDLESQADRRTYANALRTEVAAFSGVRIAELHNFRREDVRDDGGLVVRLGKGSKPRVTFLANGGKGSQTLAALRRYLDDPALRVRHLHRLDDDSPIWPSEAPAWHHWIVHRLGPASGLQRRIEVLAPESDDPDHVPPPRYYIHPHGLRRWFVVFCRRYPRTIGRRPVSWETICDLGGWDSVDTIRKHYWFADLDETHADLLESIPSGPAPLRPTISFSVTNWR